MLQGNRILGAILLAGSIASPLITTGCAEHHYYRAYDSSYGSYRPWGPDEEIRYRRWIRERHYRYCEFSRLDRDRQHEYWEWRHEHHGHAYR